MSSRSSSALIVLIVLSSTGHADDEDVQHIRQELAVKFNEMITTGQYMHSKECKASPVTFPGWDGFPVEECPYTSDQMGIDVTTTAYLLFPDAEKLARWTVNACLDAAAADLHLCVGRLGNRVWDASAGQFPVAGYVVEPPMSTTWKYPDQPYCYLFRDGVTVTTASWPDTTRQWNNMCGPAAANGERVQHAKLYGRLGSVTRSAYQKANGKESVGTDEDQSPEWSTVVGQEFRKAWNADRNFLFFASAKSDIGPEDGSIWTRKRKQ